MAQATQDLVIRMRTDSQNFNDGIDKAKGKVKDFKDEGAKVGDSFEQGMAKAKAAIGKIAIAVAAATAAIKVYKSFCDQTQTWGDELNNTIDACKTTFQSLQREILIGGNLAVGQLRKMYDEAYKLAQLKDQLGTLKISQQWNRGKYSTEFTEAMADYQEAKRRKDDDGMIKAATEVKKALNGYTKESKALIKSTKDETRQLLIANKINIKDNEDMYDVIEEVKRAQNGDLLGITETLKKLSQKTTTTMPATTGGYTAVTGGLEWGKAKMRNLGYSDAQIEMAERQLRMSELNEEKYTELVTTLMEGLSVERELATWRKQAARTMAPEVEETKNPTYKPQQPEKHGKESLIKELPSVEFKGEIQITPNGAQPLDEDWVNNALAQWDLYLAELDMVKQLENEAWEKRINSLNSYSIALGNMANMFASLTDIAADGSPWQKFTSVLGSVMGGINQLISTYTQLIQIEAVANAMKAGEVMPFPFNIALIAAAGSAIVGVISTIKQQAKSASFATGGIVGGNDYHDGIHANLSTGEMVLNKNQQTRLWSMIQSGFNNHQSNVIFKIMGEDLVGTIDNYNKNKSY